MPETAAPPAAVTSAFVLIGVFTAMVLLGGCAAPAPAPAPAPPPLDSKKLANHLAARCVMVICLPEKEARAVLRSLDSRLNSRISLSSATPLTPDGYLLTAAHAVDMQVGDSLVVLYPTGGDMRRSLAELVWKDARADLALIHVPFPTPAYYQWTPRGRTLPAGTPVVHGGISTGPKGSVGELAQSVRGSGSLLPAPFRHSLHLQPGDSGGPLITTSGELVGINRAVGYRGVMDTRFFIGSESIRPDPAKIESRIRQARLKSAP